MGKGNKSKESPNKSSIGNKEKIDCEDDLCTNKRARENSSEDPLIESSKKSNRNSAPRISESGLNVKLLDGGRELAGGKYGSPIDNSKEGSLEHNNDNNYNINSRDKFVNEQCDNRYNPKSLPPFITFIDGIGYDPEQPKSNIGNLHPMEISDLICNRFADCEILKFRRLGKSTISVEFKSFTAANRFVDNRNKLPIGWFSYVPNYKIYRSAVVRGVNPNFSDQKILDLISWPGSPIIVKNIERLKFKPKGSNDLKTSSSIKLVLETDLLPEHIFIAKWKLRVFPYINRLRRCGKCARWGHSTPFCRGRITCAKCSLNHLTDTCQNKNLRCANCKGEHHSFDSVCQVYIYNRIINAVMAYTNLSRFQATKFVKSKNIIELNQVENLCRVMAYRAWDIRDCDSVSLNSRAPSHISSRNKVSRGDSRHGGGAQKIAREMTLPLLSSSKYQSCIESPTPTNSFKNIMQRENVGAKLRELTKEKDFEDHTYAGLSPSEGDIPGFERELTKKLNEEGRNRIVLLNDIIMICQQKSKPLNYMISEIIEYLRNFEQI